MAGLKIDRFLGIRPRISDSMLGDGEATVSQNCDFAYGELRNTKSGFLYNNMSNQPSSIYTDDGLSFYSWTEDADAVRSPLSNDIYNRLYYTSTSGFYVGDRMGTRLSGGAPASPYKVGVSAPTVAVTFDVVGLKAINADTATLTWTFHYESNGTKYQEQVVAPTDLGGGKFQLQPPALDVIDAADYGSYGTPDGAFAVIRLTAVWKDTGEPALDIYSSNSSLNTAKQSWSLSLSFSNSTGAYTAALEASIGEADKETRAYVYTYVNTYGEEGPPSPAAEVTMGITSEVSITCTKDATTGYVPIKEIRLYRTPTGSTIAAYFYVGSIQILSSSATTFIFSDDVKAEMLNEELASTYSYPPSQALKGLMSLPNGILCAWKGNELHFSEAYKPWAWPPAYVITLPHNLVGGIAQGAGAVITTTAYPYIVSGVSPDSMTSARLNVEQAGVSKWSITVVAGTVVYASNDGIVTVSGGSASLAASQVYFTRDVWRTRYSAGFSTMRFANWDGRLVAYSSGSSFTPFMIRLDEAAGTLTELPAITAKCHFISPLADQFYYVSGAGVYQFNGGTDQNAVWQSREMVTEKPLNFGMGQALVQGSWTVSLYAYEAGAFSLKLTQVLTTGQTNFRLPGGYKADRYKILITGSGRFRELKMAQTAVELVTV